MTQPVVTSGDESNPDDDKSQKEELSTSDDDSFMSDIAQTLQHEHERYVAHDNEKVDDASKNPPGAIGGGDHFFYDENADDEDAAYVEQHLRRHVAMQNSRHHEQDPSASAQRQHKAEQPKHVNKKDTEKNQKLNPATKSAKSPCYSDAVLSCPCCFLTVCMDCQQHDTNPNQYRAMFVMNIIVRWDLVLTYDLKQKRLVPYSKRPLTSDSHNDNTASTGSYNNNYNNNIPVVIEENMDTKLTQEQEEIYYTVCCSNCQTQVASLDMRDEVYHFYGCLASS
ncbi:hypothetical protein ACA910_005010 [Epithemia clementina (nom. ined.)]